MMHFLVENDPGRATCGRWMSELDDGCRDPKRVTCTKCQNSDEFEMAEKMSKFFHEIVHGDDVHQAWLKAKFEKFFRIKINET